MHKTLDYVRIVNLVSSRIADETLQPGERLPSEREMAASYSVAFGTMRRAIQELHDRGLVVTLPASGTRPTKELRMTKRLATVIPAGAFGRVSVRSVCLTYRGFS